MPRPKKTGRRITIRLSEKAWKNLEGKGNIAKLINKAVEKSNEQETPTSSTPVQQPETAPDIEHLNIDAKDGVIQIYLRNKKEQERQYRIKEKVAEAYFVEKARQKAKTEGVYNRAEIEKEIEKAKQFARRYIQTGKPKVDWGNSEGEGEPDWHEGYR